MVKLLHVRASTIYEQPMSVAASGVDNMQKCYLPKLKVNGWRVVTYEARLVGTSNLKSHIIQFVSMVSLRRQHIYIQCKHMFTNNGEA